MKKSRAVVLTALVAAAGLVIAACGSSNDNASTTTAATTAATSAATSAATGAESSAAESSAETSPAETSAEESPTDTAASSADTGNGTFVRVAWNQAFYSFNGATSNGNATANNNVLYMMNSGFGYYANDNGTVKWVKNDKFGTYEKLSDDPLTVKYTINPDVKWSDGAAVDASDMLLQWAATSGHFNEGEPKYDPESGALIPGKTVIFDGVDPNIGLIKDVPKLSDDNRTMTVTYSKPFVDWENVFTAFANWVPAHVVAMHALNITDPAAASTAVIKAVQDGDKDSLKKLADVWNSSFDFSEMPKDASFAVSDGPYVLKDWVKDQYLTLAKNPNYGGWGPTPSVDEIVVRWIGDPTAAVQALQNGEVDIIQPQATADILEAVNGLSGVNVLNAEGATFEHVDLVVSNKGPFDPATYGGDKDKALKVRQAFLKTLPRQDIVTKLIVPLNPDATVRNSYTQFPASPRYPDVSGANGMTQEYGENTDVAGAKALLAEAGVTTPVKVKFLYDNTNTRRSNEFQLISAAANSAGFQMVDNGNKDWGSKLGDGSYDASLFGWQSTSLGVTSDAAIYSKGGINNLTGYNNATVNDLFNQLAGEFDPAKQTEILSKIEQELVKDAYGLPIFQFPEVTASSDQIENVGSMSLAPTVFWNFWDWKAPS